MWLVARHLPDVVLMDLRMPGLDGIEATERIVAARPETRVLAKASLAGSPPPTAPEA